MRVCHWWGWLLITVPIVALCNGEIQQLQTLLARPIEHLQGAQTVRGEFEQTKTLSGFDQALKSRGEFVQVRNHGVRWQTLEPIQSEMVLTPDGVRGMAGAEDGAAARALADIFMGLFALDLEHLSRRFHLEALEPAADETWALQLIPRDPALQDVIAQVRIAGDATLDRVRFEDALGDTTEIRLHDVELDRQAPGTDALSVFER